LGAAGFEFELELVLSGEVLVVAELPDGVVEWLQPPKIRSRLVMRQRETTRFSILPPFPFAGPD
jgi:hypothetical protein